MSSNPDDDREITPADRALVECVCILTVSTDERKRAAAYRNLEALYKLRAEVDDLKGPKK